jgi:WD40 repeat protein
MTKKSRTILFLILSIFFFILAPLTYFYAQGYRFDFEKKRICQTGAFYFKVLPKRAEIYLNGKFKKNTDFLFGSALIENLLPKEYKIEIKKEGFYPYEKSLEVKEKEVTELKNIILIPKNPKFFLIAKEKIDEFFFSPDEKKVIFKKYQKENGKKSWILEIFDLEKNNKEKLLTKKEKVKLLKLKWSFDSKNILLKLKEDKKIKYFVLQLFPKINLISLDFLNSEIKNLSFHPKDSQKIFFLKENSLFLKDFLEKKPKLILDKVISFEILKDNIIWLSASGFLYKSNLLGEILERENLKPFLIERGKEYKIITKNSLKIFLKENGDLYFLDKKEREFKKLLKEINFLKFSPDFKKVVLATKNEIWIFYFPSKDLIFLTRFSEKIENLFWFNNHYLIFRVKNKIKIAEIDQRDKPNIIDFSFGDFGKEKKALQIFYSQREKKLYVLSEFQFPDNKIEGIEI